MRSAMSNPNGLRSQKLYYYLNQGRPFNDILLRAAQNLRLGRGLDIAALDDLTL